jgi:DNA-directed RNA polymerase specialized sigma24 family protein
VTKSRSDQPSETIARAVERLRAESEAERETAWSAIYEVFTPRLLLLVSQWSSRSFSGEDAVMDTWGKFYLQVIRGLDLEPRAVWPYLRRTCLHLLSDNARQARRVEPFEETDTSRPVADWVSEGGFGHKSSGGPQAAPSEEEVAALRRALIIRLRPVDFALYQLVADGLPPAHIATRLGISRQALDVRAHRMRERLRTMEEALELYRALRRDVLPDE